MKGASTETLAMITLALVGAAWGLFWIPLRALDAAGIAGLWAVALFYLVPSLLLVPLALLRRHQIVAGGLSLHVAGLLAGAALVCYAGALVFTDIVRALLFFYLTPIWSTFLARVALAEPITLRRWGTTALGAAGLACFLQFDEGFLQSFNFGDVLGLASGLLWAVAAVRLKSAEGEGGVDFTLAYFFWGTVVAFALTALPMEGTGPPPDWATIRAVLPWFLPVALFIIIPPAFGGIWGATVLSPGIVAILFMTEISAGTISAALWADEHFGSRELLGVILISAAGLFEPVLGLMRRLEQVAPKFR